MADKEEALGKLYDFPTPLTARLHRQADEIARLQMEVAALTTEVVLWRGFFSVVSLGATLYALLH